QLLQFFNVHDLTGFGIAVKPACIAAAAALLGYVEETQKQRIPPLTASAVQAGDGASAMHAATRPHLALDARLDGAARHTLLRRWLHRPLRDQAVLGERHHAVETLLQSRAGDDLRESFRALGDLERILARIALRSARPRDLSTLRDGLALLPGLRALLAPLDSPRLQVLAAQLGEHDATAAMLARASVGQPPLLARDGGVCAEGHGVGLDELRRLSTNADQFLVDLEQREREATGIAN